MCLPLLRVMVARPRLAGWCDETLSQAWRDLNYSRPVDADRAIHQHCSLRDSLRSAQVEVLDLAADALGLDSVYCHDASLMSDAGAVVLSMGKIARKCEPPCHEAFYRRHEIPILGSIREPGHLEGGDCVWLDERSLLVGRGYRTNREGIEQLRALLAPGGVTVLEALLPHGKGPDGCLHLMSLLSVLDESHLLVDLAWLSVVTVEEIQRRGFELVALDESERDTLACNVLALGRGRLLALEENRRTNALLERAGFNVVTFPGSEIALNGGGGPTCLTRPILRR